ncbi:MAG TPA: peptidyl-prolyl cis-trans isomerase [Candidatus Desulfaltia sp.]|nr:peptidyl-prolyl cis-trans isomerase [Candidatus Desulfaltia sp.]
MKNRQVSIALLSALFGLAVAAAGQVVEEIVAIVNDDIITLSQYRQYHDQTYQMLRAQLQGEEFEKQYNLAKEQMLDTMITDLLLLQQAKKKQLSAAEEVKNYVDRLKRENNIETDAQFRQALLQQGVNYEQFLKQIEEGILRQILVSVDVDRTIVVDEAEGVTYYKQNPQEFTETEEYRLRAIYLSSEARTPEELEAKKAEISGRIQAGEDFVSLASESGDSPLKENQGDLGFIKKGELDPALEEAVVKLQTGEITPWVQAKNGWYILKLEEKKESRLKPFEEVRKDIYNKIFTERRTKKLTEYLTDLKAKNYIKILRPDPLGLP